MNDESQNRIDSIIALIMQEARTETHHDAVARIYHVMIKLQVRVNEIMRTMRE